jgi:hypothetical protein
MGKVKQIDEKFQREFVDLFNEWTMCGLQFNGSPCNTCFHTTMNDLNVPDKTAHTLWKVLLVIRGDYKEEDMEFSD